MMISENMTEKETERILKALANKRRLAIVTLLHKERERSVGEIAKAIKLSFKSTSRHLSVLVGADLIDREQRGPQIFYSLNKSAPDMAARLLKTLRIS
jgi:DNA-binding transcriptional ArsR family regulator